MLPVVNDPIRNLATPPYPPDWKPQPAVETPPPGVPPLAPPRCWCERALAMLNPTSDTVKCIGCGLPSQECTCTSLAGAL